MPTTIAVRENNHRVEYPVTKIPEDTPVLDIGMDSIRDFVGVLKKAGTVVFNGPAGLFEEADFATGTYEMLRAASRVEFSVVGGGHTAVVIEKMGLDQNFTHISTGGGACIEFLTGKVLPAVDALEKDIRIISLPYFFRSACTKTFEIGFFRGLELTTGTLAAGRTVSGAGAGVSTRNPAGLKAFFRPFMALSTAKEKTSPVNMNRHIAKMRVIPTIMVIIPS